MKKKNQFKIFFIFLFLTLVVETQASEQQSVIWSSTDSRSDRESAQSFIKGHIVTVAQMEKQQKSQLVSDSPERSGVSITTPVDGTQVPERPIIQGTVTDPGAEIWVIIHPMEVSDYWVQPRITVRQDGTWKVYVYVGRPGTMDIGKSYEIMAVANPKIKLSEGQFLSSWPDADMRSQVIEVRRK